MLTLSFTPLTRALGYTSLPRWVGPWMPDELYDHSGKMSLRHHDGRRRHRVNGTRSPNQAIATSAPWPLRFWQPLSLEDRQTHRRRGGNVRIDSFVQGLIQIHAGPLQQLPQIHIDGFGWLPRLQDRGRALRTTPHTARCGQAEESPSAAAALCAGVLQ